jgi:hypothetical protein
MRIKGEGKTGEKEAGGEGREDEKEEERRKRVG